MKKALAIIGGIVAAVAIITAIAAILTGGFKKCACGKCACEAPGDFAD